MSTVTMLRNAAGRAKGYSGCYRCGGTWDYTESHPTKYSQTSACFPLCQICWAGLTIEERLPFYEELWNEWERQAALIKDPAMVAQWRESYPLSTKQAILDAVREGL